MFVTDLLISIKQPLHTAHLNICALYLFWTVCPVYPYLCLVCNRQHCCVEAILDKNKYVLQDNFIKSKLLFVKKSSLHISFWFLACKSQIGACIEAKGNKKPDVQVRLYVIYLGAGYYSFGVLARCLPAPVASRAVPPRIRAVVPGSGTEVV